MLTLYSVSSQRLNKIYTLVRELTTRLMRMPYADCPLLVG
jgi:hypothetical protein